MWSWRPRRSHQLDEDPDGRDELYFSVVFTDAYGHYINSCESNRVHGHF